METPQIADRVPVIDAVVSLVAAIALLITGGGLLLPLGAAGIVAAQISFVAAPAILLAARGGNPLARLGFRNPGWRAAVGATLVGVSLWLVTLWLIAPLAEMWFDTSDLEELERAAESMSPVMMLAAFALAPAVCEEILFRGALARSLAPRLGALGAVVISAVLFAGFHGSAVRLLPTFFIGLALGVAAIRTRSILPAMIIHGLNNGIALSISEDQLAALGELGLVLQISAVGVSGLGFWLLWLPPITAK